MYSIRLEQCYSINITFFELYEITFSRITKYVKMISYNEKNVICDTSTLVQAVSVGIPLVVWFNPFQNGQKFENICINTVLWAWTIFIFGGQFTLY